MTSPLIKGIIYAILDDKYFYIGSTKRSILERLGEHITDSKKKNTKSKLYKYIKEVRGGWVDILYITLEELECTEKELYEKEYIYINKHIKDEGCLNIVKNDREKYIINSYMKKRRIL